MSHCPPIYQSLSSPTVSNIQFSCADQALSLFSFSLSLSLSLFLFLNSGNHTVLHALILVSSHLPPLPVMPRSENASRSNSAPGSKEVSRTSSGSSVSSLRRITRSLSVCSDGSIPFPRYSPIDAGGIFKPVRASSSQRSTPRQRTPGNEHLIPKYDPRAPAFSPIPDMTEEVTLSGDISRTASAEHLSSSRASSHLSRISSAGSYDPSLPPVVFDSSTTSHTVSRQVSTLSSPALSRTSSARVNQSHVRSVHHTVEVVNLTRTGSTEAARLGPEGLLLLTAAKKIANLSRA
jgi:hypothetical protein